MRPRASHARLAGLLLLSACGAGQIPGPPLAELQRPQPTICRLGPDEGAPAIDRGIGGTGATPQLVDRGIGGTGTPVRVVDRGIGGTGIIAVITGFASICLGGVEVAMGQDVPVTLNGATTDIAALRAGQLAVVDAVDGAGGLSARHVALLHEVSGPVESVGTNGRLRVAGQAVQLSPDSYGLRNPQVGDWVAVSGLRDPNGVVLATRLDPRPPGEVMVRGPAVASRQRISIGGLTVDGDAATLPAGPVVASGQYRGGTLLTPRIQPDRLAADPASAFPEGTRRILVESYAMATPGGVRLGGGAMVPGPAGLAAAMPQRAVVEIEREAGGALRAIGLRPDAAAPPGMAGQPAPAAPRPSQPGGAGGPQPGPVPRRLPQREPRMDAPGHGGTPGAPGSGPAVPGFPGLVPRAAAPRLIDGVPGGGGGIGGPGGGGPAGRPAPR